MAIKNPLLCNTRGILFILGLTNRPKRCIIYLSLTAGSLGAWGDSSRNSEPHAPFYLPTVIKLESYNTIITHNLVYVKDNLVKIVD